MHILRTRNQLLDYRNSLTQPIGFVPTMGALHDGHLSLVDIARQRTKCVGVSIFVNPTQFAPHEDFASYPRQEEADLAKLKNKAVDFVYLPDTHSIYPEQTSPSYSTAPLGQQLEGITRPHFFDGVALVVSRLFTQLRPTYAVFGEKDYQQLTVLKKMVQDLNLNVEIIGAPIVREADGLAMSSRNVYLNKEERRIAPHLYLTLQAIREKIYSGTAIKKALGWGKENMLTNGFTKVDYLEACDSETLSPTHELQNNIRLLGAAYLGSVRLIDNIVL